MPRMVHPDAPEPFDTLTDDQADVLRKSGWTEAEAQPKAARPRKRPARKAAKKSAAPTAVTPEAGGSKPTETEKE